MPILTHSQKAILSKSKKSFFYLIKWNIIGRKLPLLSLNTVQTERFCVISLKFGRKSQTNVCLHSKGSPGTWLQTCQIFLVNCRKGQLVWALIIEVTAQGGCTEIRYFHCHQDIRFYYVCFTNGSEKFSSSNGSAFAAWIYRILKLTTAHCDTSLADFHLS